MKSESTVAVRINRLPYYFGIACFLVFFTLLLLAVTDISRGFLFAPNYLKVGTPSVLLYLNVAQIPLLLVGALGVWLTYKYLKGFEDGPEGRGLSLKNVVLFAGIAIGLLLIIFETLIGDRKRYENQSTIN